MLVPAAEIGEARYYAYKLDGPFNPVTGDRFDDRQNTFGSVCPSDLSTTRIQPRRSVWAGSK